MRGAPGASGVPVAKAGETDPAEPFDGVRVGVSGGEEPQRCLVAEVGAECGVPVRASDLQQSVQAGEAGGAAFDQRGVQLSSLVAAHDAGESQRVLDAAAERGIGRAAYRAS